MDAKDRNFMLDKLLSEGKTPLDFQWNNLYGPSVYQYFSAYDIDQLYNIATSIKYASDTEKKLRAIDLIMKSRGFKKFHMGTNRVVYSCLEDRTFLAKVALDRVGLKDNPAEYVNQQFLAPFVTKIFHVSDNGVIGFCERVLPIMSRKEFALMANDVFDLLTKFIIGRYVLNDIGINSWMNYGIRPGFGVCILDYPYVYELDGKKLVCNNPIYPGTKFPVCGGEIDYDAGFDNLICKRCGKKHEAKDLELRKSISLIRRRKGVFDMGMLLYQGNVLIKSLERNQVKKNIPKEFSNLEYNYKSKVVVYRGNKRYDASMDIELDSDSPEITNSVTIPIDEEVVETNNYSTTQIIEPETTPIEIFVEETEPVQEEVIQPVTFTISIDDDIVEEQEEFEVEDTQEEVELEIEEEPETIPDVVEEIVEEELKLDPVQEEEIVEQEPEQEEVDFSINVSPTMDFDLPPLKIPEVDENAYKNYGFGPRNSSKFYKKNYNTKRNKKRKNMNKF